MLKIVNSYLYLQIFPRNLLVCENSQLYNQRKFSICSSLICFKMEKKKLTILFAPLNGWGATYASTGLGQELLSRGHRVVWALEESFKGKLSPLGFEEEIYYPTSQDMESWPLFTERTGKSLSEGPLEVVRKFVAPAFELMFSYDKEWDQQYRHIIERVKPNVIIIDRMVNSPALTNSGIPWVWFNSNAPHNAFNDERLPPAYSGNI